MENMPNWTLPMMASALTALVAIIYALQTGRISKLETWKDERPSADEILTKTDHLEMCDQRMEKIYETIKVTRDSLMGIRVDIARIEVKLDAAKIALDRKESK